MTLAAWNWHYIFLVHAAFDLTAAVIQVSVAAMMLAVYVQGQRNRFPVAYLDLWIASSVVMWTGAAARLCAFLEQAVGGGWAYSLGAAAKGGVMISLAALAIRLYALRREMNP